MTKEYVLIVVEPDSLSLSLCLHVGLSAAGESLKCQPFCTSSMTSLRAWRNKSSVYLPLSLQGGRIAGWLAGMHRNGPYSAEFLLTLSTKPFCSRTVITEHPEATFNLHPWIQFFHPLPLRFLLIAFVLVVNKVRRYVNYIKYSRAFMFLSYPRHQQSTSRALVLPFLSPLLSSSSIWSLGCDKKWPSSLKLGSCGMVLNRVS